MGRNFLLRNNFLATAVSAVLNYQTCSKHQFPEPFSSDFRFFDFSGFYYYRDSALADFGPDFRLKIVKKSNFRALDDFPGALDLQHPSKTHFCSPPRLFQVVSGLPGGLVCLKWVGFASNGRQTRQTGGVFLENRPRDQMCPKWPQDDPGSVLGCFRVFWACFRPETDLYL